MTAADATRTRIDRAQGVALMVGLAGLAACVGAGLVWPRCLYPSYLVGFLFWVGISLGSISLLMLHNLTGGQWGYLIRRPLEAGAMTVVPMAVLFVPIALGIKALFPWADADYVAHSEALRHKAHVLKWYLNENAFLIRAGVYFAAWIGLATLLKAAAAHRDRPGNGRPHWSNVLSGPGLGLVFFTASFAAIDWGMSREPEWYSSIYGPMVIVGWGLLTFATMIVVTAILRRESDEVARVATPGRVQDLGNLMLAFTMLWAYMSYSQYLIIWAGNLVEEIPWYLRRLRGGWGMVAVALVVFHFFVPFFALLFRDVKRNPNLIVRVAVALIVMHLVDLSWLILPARNEPLATGWTIRPAEIFLVPVAVAGIGGVWVWAFLWNLRRHPLIIQHLLDAAPDKEL